MLEKRYCDGRPMYCYGKVPEDSTDIYDDRETVFENLLKKLGYSRYKGDKTLFKKREYS